MPKVIIVVARDRPELFTYFEQVFAGLSEIKVLLDRRILPPGAKLTEASDPAHQQRRDIYDELQQRGFVMIRVG
jgi:hypothetical protein